MDKVKLIKIDFWDFIPAIWFSEESNSLQAFYNNWDTFKKYGLRGELSNKF